MIENKQFTQSKQNVGGKKWSCSFNITPTEGIKSESQSMTWAHMLSSRIVLLRPVILRHSEDWFFCWLLYFWVLRKSPECINRKCGKGAIMSHTYTAQTNMPAFTHTHGLPDVLPFLQYWQTDGAFLLCVFFIRPLVFILLTKQLSLFKKTLENAILDTQSIKHQISLSRHKSYLQYKGVLYMGYVWDHLMMFYLKPF